jgi:secondary thiamine-phosphate synthase enzyme
MISVIKRKVLLTRHETELIDITPEILGTVESSGIDEGMVFILSLHTTTGITVNEGLPDLEKDIADAIQRLVPDDHPYRHARFLHSDGQMAINAPSHLRGALLGFQTFFPVEGGKVVKGSRQTVYLVELDGPQERTYVIQIMGNARGNKDHD